MIKWVSFTKGVKFIYAYHLMFSRRNRFESIVILLVVLIQSQLDETSFRNSGNFDPIIDGDSSKDSYFNVDIGASYNYLDFMYMVP
jgi:hypothetical protein